MISFCLSLFRGNSTCLGPRFFPSASVPLAIVFSVAVSASSRGQFINVAYDGFNYSAGSLNGQNGGTGWTNAWTWTYSPGVSLSVNTTGLSYSGLTTSGGRAVWVTGGNGISEASRSLPLIDSGVVYIQFLCEFGATSGGGTPNIRLFNAGSLTGGFGGNGGTYGANMSILNTSLQPAADGSSSAGSLSALNFVVARIDYDNVNTKMWINPNAAFDYENPTAPDAKYDNLAPAFNAIAIYSRNPGNVDELRILAGPVPEPSSVSLLLLGAGVLLCGWRRAM